MIFNSEKKTDHFCKHEKKAIQDEHFYKFEYCLDCSWFDKTLAPCYLGGNKHYFDRFWECRCGAKKYG